MEEDQKLRVRLVGRDGRRRFDSASKERLVAACDEPGVSVSRLALDHGINANLLRKWIKSAKEGKPLPSSSASAFIPVQVTADCGRPMRDSVLDMSSAAPRIDGLLAKSERAGPRFLSAKVSASLPNGVKLTLECGDVDALTSIIGALGHVQTGR